MRSIRIRSLRCLENSHMEMIVVHSAAVATLLKRDCNRGVFLYCEIFANSFFYKTPPMAAFWSQRIRLLNMWKLK